MDLLSHHVVEFSSYHEFRYTKSGLDRIRLEKGCCVLVISTTLIYNMTFPFKEDMGSRRNGYVERIR